MADALSSNAGYVPEIEQFVIGSLLGGRGLPFVRSFLRDDHFIHDINRRIYAATCAAFDQSGATHLPLVRSLCPFDLDEAVKHFAGRDLNRYLADLLGGAPYDGSNAANMTRAGQAVVEQHARIRLAERMESAAIAARDPAASVAKVIQSTGNNLEEISASLRASRFTRSRMTIGEAGRTVYDLAEEAMRNGSGLTGVTWGLTDVDRWTGGMQRKDMILIGARPSMGKAQPLTAKVKTLSGWKPMGEIRIGDELASVDGRRSLVSGVFPQGTVQIFRVTFSDGRSTRVCGQHLWAVESSRFEGRKVWSTDEISRRIATERYANRLHFPLPSGDFGTSGSLPIHPWLLGVLIGNGNLTRSTPILSTADAATLFRVQAMTAGRQELKVAGDYDYRISGVGGINDLAVALGALGLRGKRSEDKFRSTTPATSGTASLRPF